MNLIKDLATERFGLCLYQLLLTTIGKYVFLGGISGEGCEVCCQGDAKATDALNNFDILHAVR